MLKCLYICLIICYASGLFCQSDYDQVVDILDKYMIATTEGNGQLLDEVFHDKASFYFSDSETETWSPSRKEFINKFYQGQEQSSLDRQSEILQIDIIGGIATAKMNEYFCSSKWRYTNLFQLKKENSQWKVFSQIVTKGSTTNIPKGKILFVVSNAHFHGTSDINTANHFFEIILPYDEFVKNGYQVDFVSPQGGPIPIGYLSYTYKTSEKYIYDFDFMHKLKNTMKPEEVDYENYKAIFYCGGGAAMYGIPENEKIQELAMNIYEEGKGVIASICHGAAGIANLKNSDGTFVYNGKKVNGFPDMFEDKKADYYKQFPFSIEEIIESRGGNFVYSKNGWDNFYTADGRLITGQDPTSSRALASKVIDKIKTN